MHCSYWPPSRQERSARFDVIDVERINVVTKNGKYTVVIANPERMPGNVVGGKEHAFAGSRGGGLHFYNRDGDEAGGLIFDNESRATSVFVFGQLSLDRYGSDQVATLRYLEEPHGWEADTRNRVLGLGMAGTQIRTFTAP